MVNVYPDYYTEFKCINKSCKHNCCIGWEIDIDNTTALKYNEFPGEFGNRLRANISKAPSRFKNLSNGRCPFLNKDNLCDIIINIGEEHLCEICKAHPRFINELPDRTEYGIGLSCEEAARIIIGKKEITKLIPDSTEIITDKLLLKRDEIFNALQNRNLTINERFELLLNENDAYIPDKTFDEWIDLFLSFERLTDEWGTTLEFLKNTHKNADYIGFNTYMTDRMHEYEQLAVYLIYRYYANSFDLYDATAVIVFTALCHKFIYSIGACIWSKNGKFTFEEQVELIRMFSAETEYSDTVKDLIFEELYSY